MHGLEKVFDRFDREAIKNFLKIYGDGVESLVRIRHFTGS